MEKIELGEIVTLDNQKEYICCHRIQDEGKTYLFMMSNFKPVEIFFAQEVIDGDEVSLMIIGDREEKQRLLQLFGSALPFTEK